MWASQDIQRCVSTDKGPCISYRFITLRPMETCKSKKCCKRMWCSVSFLFCLHVLHKFLIHLLPLDIICWLNEPVCLVMYHIISVTFCQQQPDHRWAADWVLNVVYRVAHYLHFIINLFSCNVYSENLSDLQCGCNFWTNKIWNICMWHSYKCLCCAVAELTWPDLLLRNTPLDPVEGFAVVSLPTKVNSDSSGLQRVCCQSGKYM